MRRVGLVPGNRPRRRAAVRATAWRGLAVSLALVACSESDAKALGAARETIPDLFAPRAATGAALQPGARRGQRGGPRHLLERRAHRLPSRRMTRSSWSASARCWILTS